MRMGGGQISRPLPQQQPQQLASMMPELNDESLSEQLEFEERLKALTAEAALKKSMVVAKEEAQSGVLSLPSYENPPPITSTLFGANSKDASETSFGPSQVGLAAASLLLVGIFLVANGGTDLGYATRRSSATQATAPQLAPEQKADVEARLLEVTKQLDENAANLEALEESAVLHVRLGDYSIAADQLEKLTAAKPGDVDAWRLLGETRSAEGKTGKSVAAYQKAWAASEQSNLEVFTALASALVYDDKPQEAVERVRSALDSATVKSNLGDVELGLLLAKTYSQWRGHVPDALAQYDALAEAHPNDFRPPLGKGLLLRQQGSEGDAQRFLTQAKFLAPKASRAAVDALSSKK